MFLGQFQKLPPQVDGTKPLPGTYTSAFFQQDIIAQLFQDGKFVKDRLYPLLREKTAPTFQASCFKKHSSADAKKNIQHEILHHHFQKRSKCFTPFFYRCLQETLLTEKIYRQCLEQVVELCEKNEEINDLFHKNIKKVVFDEALVTDELLEDNKTFALYFRFWHRLTQVTFHEWGKYGFSQQEITELEYLEKTLQGPSLQLVQLILLRIETAKKSLKMVEIHIRGLEILYHLSVSCETEYYLHVYQKFTPGLLFLAKISAHHNMACEKKIHDSQDSKDPQNLIKNYFNQLHPFLQEMTSLSYRQKQQEYYALASTSLKNYQPHDEASKEWTDRLVTTFDPDLPYPDQLEEIELPPSSQKIEERLDELWLDHTTKEKKRKPKKKIFIAPESPREPEPPPVLQPPPWPFEAFRINEEIWQREAFSLTFLGRVWRWNKNPHHHSDIEEVRQFSDKKGTLYKYKHLSNDHIKQQMLYHGMSGLVEYVLFHPTLKKIFVQKTEEGAAVAMTLSNTEGKIVDKGFFCWGIRKNTRIAYHRCFESRATREIFPKDLSAFLKERLAHTDDESLPTYPDIPQEFQHLDYLETNPIYKTVKIWDQKFQIFINILPIH